MQRRIQPSLRNQTVSLRALLDSLNNEFTTIFQADSTSIQAIDDTQTIHQLAHLTMIFNQVANQVSCYQDNDEYNSTQMAPNINDIVKLPKKYLRKLVYRLASERRGRSYIERASQRGPYRTYTLKEKEYIIQLNKRGMTYAAISKNLRVPQKNVVRWCKEGIVWKLGAGRKIADQTMESLLSDWIKNQVTRRFLTWEEIQEHAFSLTSNPSFKASKGWFRNFCKRYKLTYQDIICYQSL